MSAVLCSPRQSGRSDALYTILMTQLDGGTAPHHIRTLILDSYFVARYPDILTRLRMLGISAVVYTLQPDGTLLFEYHRFGPSMALF